MHGLVYGQSVDSLRIVLEYENNPTKRADVMYQLAYAKIFTNPVEADSIITEGILLANRNGDHNLLGNFFYLRGYQKEHLKQFHDAFIAYTYALAHHEQSNNLVQLAKCHEAIGRFNLIVGDVDAAKEQFHQAYLGYVSSQAWDLLANFQYRLGKASFDNKEWDEALIQFQQALAFYSKEQIPFKQSQLLVEIAYTYLQKGELSLFENYLDLADQIILENRSDIDHGFLDASIKNNRAVLAYRKGDHQKATALTIEALDLANEVNNPYLKQKFLNNAVELAIERKDFAIALDYIQESLSMNVDYNDQTFRTYKLAVQAHSALGNWEQALALEEERNALEVSEEQMNAAELKAQQAAAISMAQAELEVEAAHAKVQEARQRTWIIAGSILLACILIAYLFYRRMAFYRKEAWRHATNWPELQRKMDALEETLGMMG